MMLCVLRGGSMRPFLRPGAILLLEPARIEELRPGGVVVFRQEEGGLVAHRVVSVKHFPCGPCVRTQGDRSALMDPALSQQQLVGRVAAFWQGGRMRRTGPGRDAAALATVRLWRLVRCVSGVRQLMRRMGVWFVGGGPKTRQTVVYRREGEEALLFDPQSGEVRLLNETGRAVWEMLAQGADPDAIAERLSEEFDTPDRAALTRDIERFLAELQACGLVAQAAAPQPGGPPAARG